MKNGLWLLAGTVAVVAAAACSSGSSSGGSGLSTGTYLASNVATAPDGCQVGTILPVANGDSVDVVVLSTALTVNGFDFVATNGSVNSAGGIFTGAPTVTDIDWTTTAGQSASGVTPLSRGYNCHETDSYLDHLSVTSKNHFHYSLNVRYVMVSGSAGACVAANNSAFGIVLAGFPCLSTASYDAAK